jgi:hypothetical protein
MSSSPFASYRSQPARPQQHGGRAPRPTQQVYPFRPLACPPLKVQAYKPPRQPRSSRTVLVVLAVVLGVPAALVLLLGLIVTGVATIPAVGGVVVALILCQPARRANKKRRR